MTTPTRLGIARAPAHVFAGGAGLSRLDDVVVEEPLEIRIAGDPIATTMRTPGDDRFLALGFLFAEGVIANLAAIASVSHCGRTDDPGYGHTLDVVPASKGAVDWGKIDRSRRGTTISSACGVCGRQTIDDLRAALAPVSLELKVPGELVAAAPEILAQGQANFARTGGLHAAAAIDVSSKAVLAFAEDIGRHNAVDKVVGKLLYENRLPRQSAGQSAILAVSGRASFEIVQKAAMAGFAAVVSVSAASSLAIETASALGVTLAAFARAGRFTLYSHPDRITNPR